MPGIYTLNGVVKHYDWGGNSFIPSLLQVPNTWNKPFAEYWLGIHPLGSATADTGGSSPTDLSMLVPELPFLLKILDVKQMLSIQVHPSKAVAEAGFAEEDARGIPRDAAERNYKDSNHKPELSVALGDFWLLYGFKSPRELEYTLLNVVELRELLPVYNSSGYNGLYRHVMEMPQNEVNRILQPLLDNLANTSNEGIADKSDEEHWVAKAVQTFVKDGNIDRGIFSIYLLNIVNLKKGQGIFLDAGVPHAYLEGQIVEIMANSDNVLRGGLTTKYIDIKELLKNVKAEGISAKILSAEPVNEQEGHYSTPYPDFQLNIIQMEAGDIYNFSPQTPEIILLTNGSAELDDDEIDLKLKAGSPAALVFPGKPVYLAASSKSTVFRASGTVHNR